MLSSQFQAFRGAAFLRVSDCTATAVAACLDDFPGPRWFFNPHEQFFERLLPRAMKMEAPMQSRFAPRKMVCLQGSGESDV